MSHFKKEEIYEQGKSLKALQFKHWKSGNFRTSKVKDHKCSDSLGVRERCVLPYNILLEAQVCLEHSNKSENC